MKKKFLALVLSTVLALNPLSISAETVTITGEDVTEEIVQDVEVTLSKGAAYVVALPKNVELTDGTEYELKAGLYAEIDSTVQLVIEPIDSNPETAEVIDFNLVNIVEDESKKKPDVNVIVVPVKTEWKSDDSDFCDDVNDIVLECNQVVCCTMSVDEVPMGEWKGNLSIRIALEDFISTLGVDIVDSTNSNNLNGVATFITGNTRTTLLNELVESGHILDAREVDALVNVDCDSFDDTATAIFSVRGIAEPGERIVIYHYDEEASEWEYIDTAVVDSNYQIVCEFNSFSPVGFVNIGAVGEEHICNYIETAIREASCVTNGVTRFACECGSSYIEVSETLRHSYADCICEVCGYEPEPGLYDAEGKLLCTWEKSGIDITADYSDTTHTETNHIYTVITQKYPTTTMVVVPRSITYLGSYSFSLCSMLEEIVLPDNITSTGVTVFYWCTGLTKLRIPQELTVLNTSFAYCCSDLKEIIWPRSLTVIGDRALYRTAFESVVIPGTVKTIGADAFNQCFKLESVTFENSNGWYVGDTAGAKTTALNSALLFNPATTAEYLTTTYVSKHWTK